MPADPKPAKRVKADAEEWRLIRHGKIGPCRGCRVPGRNIYAVTMHHIVPKSLGGDDVSENIIPLCGSGTHGCHGLIESHGRGHREIASRIRHRLRPEELRYALTKKGDVWLDEYYPL